MEERFDRDLWLKSASGDQSDGARMKLAGALIANINSRVGQYDRAQIREILGEPEQTSKQFYFYYIGVGEFSVAGTFVAIQFDSQGKFERAFLTRR